jgi:hypothetical protein
MMMTTSSNDAEALIALRKANAILAEAKVNWAELLAASRQADDFRVPPSKRRRADPDDEWENVGDKHDDAGEIESLFERAFARAMTEEFEGFLTSVRMFWEQRGYLTEKQYAAVRRAARR